MLGLTVLRGRDLPVSQLVPEGLLQTEACYLGWGAVPTLSVSESLRRQLQKFRHSPAPNSPGPQFPYLQNGDSDQDLLPRFPVEQKGSQQWVHIVHRLCISSGVAIMLLLHRNVEFSGL